MSLIEGINDNFYKIIFDFKVTKTVFEKSSLIWRLQRWFYKNHVWSLHNFSLSNSLLCPHCHAFTLSWPSLYRSLCRDLRSLSQPPSCPWFCFFTLPYSVSLSSHHDNTSLYCRSKASKIILMMPKIFQTRLKKSRRFKWRFKRRLKICKNLKKSIKISIKRIFHRIDWIAKFVQKNFSKKNLLPEFLLSGNRLP